jgi:hypothetical protein
MVDDVTMDGRRQSMHYCTRLASRKKQLADVCRLQWRCKIRLELEKLVSGGMIDSDRVEYVQYGGAECVHCST